MVRDLYAASGLRLSKTENYCLIEDDRIKITILEHHQDGVMRTKNKSKINQIIILLGLSTLICLLPHCASMRPFTDISPNRAEALIHRHTDDPDFVILDVRGAEEYNAGHLDGALNIPIKSPDFADRIEALDKSATYLVYCYVGIRSARAMNLMKEKGFEQVFNLEGGLGKWEAAKQSLE